MLTSSLLSLTTQSILLTSKTHSSVGPLLRMVSSVTITSFTFRTQTTSDSVYSVTSTTTSSPDILHRTRPQTSSGAITTGPDPVNSSRNTSNLVPHACELNHGDKNLMAY